MLTSHMHATLESFVENKVYLGLSCLRQYGLIKSLSNKRIQHFIIFQEINNRSLISALSSISVLLLQIIHWLWNLSTTY